MGHSKGSLDREVHSDTGLFIKIETFQINSLMLHLQELEEQQQTKARTSTRKEITKIRAELNDIETKSTIQMIITSRTWFFEKINKNRQAFNNIHQEKRRRSK